MTSAYLYFEIIYRTIVKLLHSNLAMPVNLYVTYMHMLDLMTVNLTLTFKNGCKACPLLFPSLMNVHGDNVCFYL